MESYQLYNKKLVYKQNNNCQIKNCNLESPANVFNDFLTGVPKKLSVNFRKHILTLILMNQTCIQFFQAQ